MRTVRSTAKKKILNAAWDLFREIGYEETTIDDIIRKSGTSRGAFYHHFRAKEDLLFQLASFFDENYKGWLEKHPPQTDPIQTLYEFLIYTTREVEESEYRDLLATLYGYEVMTTGTRYILDENREYFQIILKICKEAKKQGLLEDWSEYSLTRTLAGIHRGLTYNWLLEGCRYSLVNSSAKVFKAFLKSVKTV